MSNTHHSKSNEYYPVCVVFAIRLVDDRILSVCASLSFKGGGWCAQKSDQKRERAELKRTEGRSSWIFKSLIVNCCSACGMSEIVLLDSVDLMHCILQSSYTEF